VPVLAGALVGSNLPFLLKLYAHGIRGSYDGLAVHPYSDPGFAGLTALHAAQLAAGDSTQIWATEFGAPTGSDPTWHVSEDGQATVIRNGFAFFDRTPWVQAAIVYNLRDKGTSAGNMQDNFGLLRRDFTPKPGYTALTEALHGTGNTTAVREAATTPRLSLQAKRSGRRLVVRGKGAPTRARIRVRIISSAARNSKAVVVRASRKGTFTLVVAVGSARHLRIVAAVA
jgi:hypothetical protein